MIRFGDHFANIFFLQKQQKLWLPLWFPPMFWTWGIKYFYFEAKFLLKHIPADMQMEYTYSEMEASLLMIFWVCSWLYCNLYQDTILIGWHRLTHKVLNNISGQGRAECCRFTGSRRPWCVGMNVFQSEPTMGLAQTWLHESSRVHVLAWPQ